MGDQMDLDWDSIGYPLAAPLPDASGAVISGDGVYRYRLWRTPPSRARVAYNPGVPFSTPEPRLAFIMLNPSTADERLDDATIRRCLGYARTWGYSRVDVGNLYGYRSSSPALLKMAGFPVGEENDRHLVEIAKEAHCIVVAWGAHAEPARAAHVLRLLQGLHGTVYALGFTKEGAPLHPLRQRADARLQIVTNARTHAVA